MFCNLLRGCGAVNTANPVGLSIVYDGILSSIEVIKISESLVSQPLNFFICTVICSIIST